jgi:DNA-binding transcriptional LysR family regulator
MDRVAGMAVFTKVVATGSFSAAARELRVSQASVTKQIKELEGWLGARLLNRTTRRLSLTEVGAGFYERSTRILEAVEEARSAAGALQTAPRGRLRINAPVSFGLLHLAPAVTEFLNVYPDVSIEMLVNDRVLDLLEGEFDVGVRIGRLARAPDRAGSARRLRSARIPRPPRRMASSGSDRRRDRRARLGAVSRQQRRCPALHRPCWRRDYSGPDLPYRRGLASGPARPAAVQLSAARAGAARIVSAGSVSLGKGTDLC